MENFKWLHLSDLHFKMCEKYDMTLILDRLKEQLLSETKEEKFKYIFLTGDLADGNDFSVVEENIKKILLDSDILEEDGNIFWVCGNHDVTRKKKYRNSVIAEIRDENIKESNFESKFEDEESRELLLGVFKQYNTLNDKLFKIQKSESDYPHQIIHTEAADIVLLNTCLTSYDDYDEHQLFVCEKGIINLFNEIEAEKPVFVLGHHSLSYLNSLESEKLLDLFIKKKITVYLCGHSHKLGVRPLTDEIREVVSGGFKIDGYAVVSFFVGKFYGENKEYELIPYVYRESGCKEWVKDYTAVQGIKDGQKYPIILSGEKAEIKLLDEVKKYSNIVKKIESIGQINVNKINKIGEALLREYASVVYKSKNVNNMNFGSLCNLAIENGKSNINYTSLKLTEIMPDLWSFNENFNNILREMGKTESYVKIIKEPLFDFMEFFEAIDKFNVMDNEYVLVTGPVHDIQFEKRKLLAEMKWDVILDYDGYSSDEGLRGATNRQNLKDLNARYQIIKESVFRRGITSWIQFGENLEFMLEDNEHSLNLQQIKNIFKELTEKLYSNSNGKIIFILIKNIEAWDKELMRIVWERFGQKAYFALVGAYDEDEIDRELHNLFLDTYGNSVHNCYGVFQTSKKQFFEKYCKYSENFLEAERHDSLLLPSNMGIHKMEQNIYINLGDFFEILTADVGKNLENHKESIEKFYLGGEVDWTLFYGKDVLNLLEADYFENKINQLKTTLGVKQNNARDAVFYLLHQAGFGGTTVARNIAWKLHNEYPTLILKNYELGKIKPLIQNLYDNHSRKGILVIADESRFSISDLENLENEMCSVDRPFALLIVRRMYQGKEGLNSKKVIRLNVLAKDTIDQLRTRFKEQSTLDASILKEKDDKFDDIFVKNSSMRCPFLIGLYYQDTRFNGVSEYAERVIREVNSESEIKLILIMAIINYYGRIGVSKEIVRKYIPLVSNADYLEKYSYAKEAFIKVYDDTMQMELYREKHPLISLELIKESVDKLYKCKYQEKLKDVSVELIKTIMKLNSTGINLYYKNLLERLFIYKNAIDVDEQGYTNVTEFSPLIEALPSQSSKEEVMHELATEVKNTVEQIPVEGNGLYYKMAAHICGHLGRIYKASTSSLNMMENGHKSIKWCECAENIMRMANFEDPYIYHMHGTSLAKQCSDKMKMGTEEQECLSEQEIDDIENMVEKSIDKFDKAIFSGETVRGGVSKLSLLMEYMRFLMRQKEIRNSDEIRKLTDAQRGYIKDIEVLIDMLEELQLDSRDEQRVFKLKSDFKAEIMFNNYGKAVEYYTNAITNIVRKKGEDAYELYVLRSSLAGAILGKYTQKGLNPYVEMKTEDIDRVLDALEKNIFSTVVLEDKWERQRRGNDCYRWLRVAKLSTKSVKVGIDVADKWRDLQREIEVRDPRPYYYLTVLHYLNTLDGYQASIELAKKYQRDTYNSANTSSSLRIVNMGKIRDILVSGIGIARIKSVNDLPEVLEKEQNNIVKVRGKFHDIEKDKNSKIGVINVTFPQEFRNLKVYFKMGGQNTIDINQTTHILEFGVGFSFERLEAINNTVKDITNNEKQI